MKIFISADIEGTTGIADWNETELFKPDHKYFGEQMTREVCAACNGAIEAGADEIFIKDAHDSGRNIDPAKLPANARIMRSWTKDPLVMMAGLDESFDGVLFTGYHSAAGTNGNPLAHTMNRDNEYIKINGELASEFLINSYIAAMYKVPVLFLSGDKVLCESAEKLNGSIRTVAVNEGRGNASISMTPFVAIDLIQKEVLKAVSGDLSKCTVELPEHFKVEVLFREHYKAYKAGFYPGAVQTGEKTVEYQSSDYMDVLKFFLFTL